MKYYYFMGVKINTFCKHGVKIILIIFKINNINVLTYLQCLLFIHTILIGTINAVVKTIPTVSVWFRI